MPTQRRVLLTTGPTHEPIDQVRYLGNRSSGRMGIALALESSRRGHSTTLLLGPVDREAVPHHSHLRLRRFQTAAELHELLLDEWPRHDLLIMAAAVADFRPVIAPEAKLDRRTGPITLTLEPTPDLLASLITLTKHEQIRIGFALEPMQRLETSARAKLSRKQLDAIVANPIETIGAETVEGVIYTADGRTLRPKETPCSKTVFAAWAFDVFEGLVPTVGDSSARE